MVKIFRQVGADNATFIWCPVVPSAGSASLSRCFPGDRYVDLVGMDGYNAGTAADWGGWLGFSEVFGGLYQRVRRLSRRPVIIAETGCAKQGGASRTRSTTRSSGRCRSASQAVRAVVWYDEHREANWRLDSTPATLRTARNVFTSGVFT